MVVGDDDDDDVIVVRVCAFAFFGKKGSDGMMLMALDCDL
jgi:hypothetical protein